MECDDLSPLWSAMLQHRPGVRRFSAALSRGNLLPHEFPPINRRSQSGDQSPHSRNSFFPAYCLLHTAYCLHGLKCNKISPTRNENQLVGIQTGRQNRDSRSGGRKCPRRLSSFPYLPALGEHYSARPISRPRRKARTAAAPFSRNSRLNSHRENSRSIRIPAVPRATKTNVVVPVRGVVGVAV
jgi:hypothetical protein